MAVVSFNEMLGADGTLNDQNKAEYTRRFQIEVSSALDSVTTVLDYSGVPRIGDVFATAAGEVNSAATCREVRAQQDTETWRIWEVEAKYGLSTSAEQQQSEQQQQNPLKRPCEINWGFEKYYKTCRKDASGKPFLNSAGMAFDPPPEIEDSQITLVISRNEGGFDADLASEFINTVNQTPFFGFAAGTVKLGGISSRRQIENNLVFWNTEYRFEIRTAGWKLEILDAGYYRYLYEDETTSALDQVPGRKQILVGGCPVTQPVPLAGDGYPLDNPSPANAVYRDFEPFPKKNFKALRLP